MDSTKAVARARKQAFERRVQRHISRTSQTQPASHATNSSDDARLPVAKAISTTAPSNWPSPSNAMCPKDRLTISMTSASMARPMK